MTPSLCVEDSKAIHDRGNCKTYDVLEPSEVTSFSQIRAQTPNEGLAIRQRSSPSQQQVEALQVSPV